MGRHQIAVKVTPFVRDAGGRQSSQTIACPALRFEELNVSPVDRAFGKLLLPPTPPPQKNAD